MSQANSNNSQNLNHQDRFYKVYADIGEIILAFISGEVFAAAAERITLLFQAKFVPSGWYGCTNALAFFLNMKESGARDLALRNHLPVIKPGQDRIYHLPDAARKFTPQIEEKTEESVAHTKLKRIRRRKNPSTDQ